MVRHLARKAPQKEVSVEKSYNKLRYLNRKVEMKPLVKHLNQRKGSHLEVIKSLAAEDPRGHSGQTFPFQRGGN